MPKRISIVGKTFGRLRVLSDIDDEGNLLGTPSNRRCIAVCECGTVRKYSCRSIRRGHTLSCGCLHSETIKTHGLSGHPLSAVYRSMVHRCESEKSTSYRFYGARGISVCKEWKDDFMQFYEWACSNGWKRGMHVDRIDGDGDYCPDNCRLVTQTKNNNNRRSNKFIDVCGQRLTIAEAARQHKMPYDRLYQRINKLGWEPEKAVSS